MFLEQDNLASHRLGEGWREVQKDVKLSGKMQGKCPHDNLALVFAKPQYQ